MLVYTRTLEEGRTTVLETSLRNKKTRLAVEEKQVVREQGQQVKHQVDSWNLNESDDPKIEGPYRSIIDIFDIDL